MYAISKMGIIHLYIFTIRLYFKFFKNHFNTNKTKRRVDLSFNSILLVISDHIDINRYAIKNQIDINQ
uniref:Uncharacterized protein n=1 Tax=Ascaris lumbricoides TaxID=6252 RepID=A0A0M3IL05_ASCLU